MERNMKSLIKQLAIAALILTSVTVASFGIRQVRFSIYQAKNIENPVIAEAGESTASARSSDPQNQSQPRQPLGANAGPDYYLADSYTVEVEPDYYPAYSLAVDIEPDPQPVKASDSNKEVPSKAKSFKGGYAKSTGSKDMEKISLGDNENLYVTGKGELWYVSKEADGSTTKMQVQVDDRGDMTIVSGDNYAKSGGSQSLQRISVGDREDLYITGENQVWYVSEQPDGSTAKMQLETENIDGEITIVDNDKNE